MKRKLFTMSVICSGFLFTALAEDITNPTMLDNNKIQEVIIANNEKISSFLVSQIQAVLPNTKIAYIEKNKYVPSLFDTYIIKQNREVELFMVNPYSQTFIIGEMISKDGRFLTTSDKQNFQNRLPHEENETDQKTDVQLTPDQTKKLLGAGVKFNSVHGDHKFLLFLSTSCPHCINLTAELDKKNIQTYRFYSYSKEAIELYKQKGIKDIESKFKEQGELSQPLNINFVPYVIILDKDNNVVEKKQGVRVSDFERYLTNTKKN